MSRVWPVGLALGAPPMQHSSCTVTSRTCDSCKLLAPRESTCRCLFLSARDFLPLFIQSEFEGRAIERSSGAGHDLSWHLCADVVESRNHLTDLLCAPFRVCVSFVCRFRTCALERAKKLASLQLADWPLALELHLKLVLRPRRCRPRGRGGGR